MDRHLYTVSTDITLVAGYQYARVMESDPGSLADVMMLSVTKCSKIGVKVLDPASGLEVLREDKDLEDCVKDAIECMYMREHVCGLRRYFNVFYRNITDVPHRRMCVCKGTMRTPTPSAMAFASLTCSRFLPRHLFIQHLTSHLTSRSVPSTHRRLRPVLVASTQPQAHQTTSALRCAIELVTATATVGPAQSPRWLRWCSSKPPCGCCHPRCAGRRPMRVAKGGHVEYMCKESVHAFGLHRQLYCCYIGP